MECRQGSLSRCADGNELREVFLPGKRENEGPDFLRRFLYGSVVGVIRWLAMRRDYTLTLCRRFSEGLTVASSGAV